MSTTRDLTVAKYRVQRQPATVGVHVGQRGGARVQMVRVHDPFRHGRDYWLLGWRYGTRGGLIIEPNVHHAAVRSRRDRTIRCAARAAAGLALLLALGGCSGDVFPFLTPGGPIAEAQRDLFFLALGFMAIVVIPVFVLTFLFVRRYRASRQAPDYDPDWEHSKLIDSLVWGVPALIVLAVAALVWIYTHRLDPYRPIGSAAETTRVQAIALNWRWVFVYPDHGIATVNELAFPAGKPLAVDITSDTTMSSFMVVGLGGQIYAMAGMRTKLHLLSNKPGTYTGRNMQYSGDGFSNQTFRAVAMTPADFAAWIAKVKAAGRTLDAATYETVRKPVIDRKVAYYSGVEPDLFKKVIARYPR